MGCDWYFAKFQILKMKISLLNSYNCCPLLLVESWYKSYYLLLEQTWRIWEWRPIQFITNCIAAAEWQIWGSPMFQLITNLSGDQVIIRKNILVVLDCYSLQEIYQQKRNEHLKEMHAREEHMRAMFVQKVSVIVLQQYFTTSSNR